LGPAGLQRLEDAVLQHADALELRQLAADGLDVLLVPGRFDPDVLRRGIRGDRLALAGGGGLVDRHADARGPPHRPVRERPLVPGAGEDPDPVAGLDARGDQPLRDLLDLVDEVGGAHGAVGAVLLRDLVDRHRGIRAEPPQQQVRRILVRTALVLRGRGVLLHRISFDPARWREAGAADACPEALVWSAQAYGRRRLRWSTTGRWAHAPREARPRRREDRNGQERHALHR